MIKYDKRNYRKHDDRNKALIKKSLEDCGTGRSIVIDNDNSIIAGNGVYEQAAALGLPVRIIETDGKELIAVKRTDINTDDDKRKQLAVMDNSTSDSSMFDFDLLQTDFEIDTLESWGIDVEALGGDVDTGEIEEDEIPEEVQTVCKRGDIWQLGNHRLMCGDSTSPEDVALLMNGNKADMVFTDPPYGMKKEKDGVLNDNLNFDDLLDFNKQWIPLTFTNLKKNGSWYCWGIDEPLMDIYSNILKPMIKENKITFRNLITWNKGNGQGQLSEDFRMYAIADEKCLFVMCGVQRFNTNADNYFEKWEPIRVYLKEQRDLMGWSNGEVKTMCGHSATSGCHWFDKSQWMLPTEEEYQTWQKHAKGKAFKREYNEIKREYNEIKREYNESRSYFDNTHDNMNNVWSFARTSQEERTQARGHATPKPVVLCSRAIKSSSREGAIVLDVFGGSGSTLIACEQTGRKCYTMELNEHYCDVILQRYINFKGSDVDVFLLRDGKKISYSK